MPLPSNGTAWPLPGHGERYRRMEHARAYWAGSPDALRGVGGYAEAQTFTGGPSTTTNPAGFRRAVGSVFARFWGSRLGTEVDTRRHLPIPQDICTIGAELLFSEPLRINIDGPTYDADSTTLDADGEPTYREGDPMPETVAAQQRLDANLQAIGFGATLMAAAESAAALGSAALSIAWDKAPDSPIVDRPTIVRTEADAVYPEYRWGILVAVTLWSQVYGGAGKATWRLLERREGGRASYGLYRGSDDNLGERVPIGTLTSLQGLASTLTAFPDESTVLTPTAGLKTAVSVPNMLPDALDSKNASGRSDFTPATFGLFDDADRMYTDLMDEQEDAKSRLFIADALLEKRGVGQALGFDTTQRVWRMNIPPADEATGQLPIEKVQFDLKTTERLAGIEWVKRQAIESAGYNLATLGEENGQAVAATAYEVRQRNKRSLSTRDKKAAWWRSALADLLTAYLAIDVEQFAPVVLVDGSAQRVQAFPVRVEFAEDVQPTKGELLADAALMVTADAGSTRTRVAYVNPEWTPKLVDDEVARIKADKEAEQAIDPIALNPGVGGAAFGPGQGV